VDLLHPEVPRDSSSSDTTSEKEDIVTAFEIKPQKMREVKFQEGR
jgi:hypothetical protein